MAEICYKEIATNLSQALTQIRYSSPLWRDDLLFSSIKSQPERMWQSAGHVMGSIGKTVRYVMDRKFFITASWRRCYLSGNERCRVLNQECVILKCKKPEHGKNQHDFERQVMKMNAKKYLMSTAYNHAHERNEIVIY
jgi:hypothetical protein